LHSGHYNNASCSFGYARGSTLLFAAAIRPFSSITYAIRFAYSSCGDVAAPYAMPIFRSVSHSSGKGNLYFAANLALSAAVSKLAPRIWTFFAW
jgi:hypothetical protein